MEILKTPKNIKPLHDLYEKQILYYAENKYSFHCSYNIKNNRFCDAFLIFYNNFLTYYEALKKPINIKVFENFVWLNLLKNDSNINCFLNTAKNTKKRLNLNQIPICYDTNDQEEFADKLAIILYLWEFYYSPETLIKKWYEVVTSYVWIQHFTEKICNYEGYEIYLNKPNDSINKFYHLLIVNRKKSNNIYCLDGFVFDYLSLDYCKNCAKMKILDILTNPNNKNKE
jgi:hypothetical protein